MILTKRIAIVRILSLGVDRALLIPGSNMDIGKADGALVCAGLVCEGKRPLRRGYGMAQQTDAAEDPQTKSPDQWAVCAAIVSSRAPTASRSSSCAFAAMSSIEGELASNERARPTISALVGM